MAILIKGMEMPKGNSALNVLIYSDGRIFTGHKKDDEYLAVEVPTPHGRLIDADALTGKAYMDGKLMCVEMDDIEEAPTIIEAEE